MLAVGFVYGCSGNDTPKTESLSFDVADSLLGPVYVVERAGIELRPPLGFEPIGDTLLVPMQQQFVKPSGYGPADSIRLAQFFFDSTTHAALVVATVGGLTAEQDTGAYVQGFRAELNRVYGAENVTSGDYMIGKILVKNFVAGDSTTVRQTLLCLVPGGDAAEMQFIIPRSEYAGLLKSLESSIGTVTTTQTEEGR